VTDTQHKAPRAFDSGLTTPDFAACLSMGLQPVGLVQGFYCGQLAGWASYTASVTHRYGCPHGYMGAEHPPPDWIGSIDALDQAWRFAHATALQRMVQEAAEMGAHGVVGVTTEFAHPTNQHSSEAHLYGTAVRSLSGSPPPYVWTTRLAGHKLAKLVEAGFVPHSVVYARNTSVLAEGCIMESFKQGFGGGAAIDPLHYLHTQVRELALADARRLAPNESLYDVDMAVHEFEAPRASYLTCTLLGSAVRKVRHTLSLPVPVATVSLADQG
jgi:hypothetical protein